MNRDLFKIPLCVTILVIKENKIYLIERANTGWSDGYYALPGGCVEPNESVRDAAAREAHEEIGIIIKTNNLKFVQVGHVLADNNFEYIIFSFAVTNWQGEPSNKEQDKHKDGKWFNLDNLPDNTMSFAKEIIAAYQNNKYYAEYGWPKN